MKWASFLLGVGVVVAVLALSSLATSSRLAREVVNLEREKQALQDYARRLAAQRRVAQVEVVRQQPSQDGRVLTTLMWQEIGAGGVLGKPLAVEVYGAQIYLEALVLKFHSELVGEGDPVRGQSLALFRRIFGDQQAPETAAALDRAARPPVDSDPRQADPVHDRLWGLFWKLVDEPALAREYGVRVAQIEAPAAPMKPGDRWEVSLDAAGGLNLKRLIAVNTP